LGIHRPWTWLHDVSHCNLLRARVKNVIVLSFLHELLCTYVLDKPGPNKSKRDGTSGISERIVTND
jgi:hypothetical protein